MPKLEVFYEINTEYTSTYNLPHMFEEEKVLFDAINNAGAVPIRALLDYAKRLGHSQADTNRALSSLLGRGLITRRTLTLEL